MRFRALWFVLAFAGFASVWTYAQQALVGPTFEVASVKQNTSGDARTSGQFAGNRFAMINETLWRLIGEAYAGPQVLPRSRIIGGPQWIEADRFDVEGVAAAAFTRDQARGMLRALLAERFNLVVHTETRDLPVFALVVDRNDGKLGPRLSRSEAVCPPPPPLAPNPLPTKCVIEFGFGRLTATGVTISQLATAGLSRVAGRNVIDRTGLTGLFDWTLAWTPDNLPPRAPGTPEDQPLRVNGVNVDPNGPSLATALKEQLGLKLDATASPIEVVVIDHVEHPSEN